MTNPQGNHGEDVKECYFYLDSDADALVHEMRSTSIRRRRFRIEQLVEDNRPRGRSEPEFELVDTGVFDEDRYFDVFAEYAKAGADDI